jgi:hypothetical protein
MARFRFGILLYVGPSYNAIGQRRLINMQHNTGIMVLVVVSEIQIGQEGQGHKGRTDCISRQICLVWQHAKQVQYSDSQTLFGMPIV